MRSRAKADGSPSATGVDAPQIVDAVGLVDVVDVGVVLEAIEPDPLGQLAALVIEDVDGHALVAYRLLAERTVLDAEGHLSGFYVLGLRLDWRYWTRRSRMED